MNSANAIWARNVMPDGSGWTAGSRAAQAAITSFRLKGMRTDEDAKRVQRVLFERYRIHAVWRGGIAKGPAIRVTPGLYSTPADVDALAAALWAEHAMFI